MEDGRERTFRQFGYADSGGDVVKAEATGGI